MGAYPPMTGIGVDPTIPVINLNVNRAARSFTKLVANMKVMKARKLTMMNPSSSKVFAQRRK
jgi:hypothetical protein